MSRVIYHTSFWGFLFMVFRKAQGPYRDPKWTSPPLAHRLDRTSKLGPIDRNRSRALRQQERTISTIDYIILIQCSSGISHGPEAQSLTVRWQWFSLTSRCHILPAEWNCMHLPKYQIPPKSRMKYHLWYWVHEWVKKPDESCGPCWAFHLESSTETHSAKDTQASRSTSLPNLKPTSFILKLNKLWRATISQNSRRIRRYHSHSCLPDPLGQHYSSINPNLWLPRWNNILTVSI